MVVFKAFAPWAFESPCEIESNVFQVDLFGCWYRSFVAHFQDLRIAPTHEYLKLDKCVEKDDYVERDGKQAATHTSNLVPAFQREGGDVKLEGV